MAKRVRSSKVKKEPVSAESVPVSVHVPQAEPLSDSAVSEIFSGSATDDAESSRDIFRYRIGVLLAVFLSGIALCIGVYSVVLPKWELAESVTEQSDVPVRQETEAPSPSDTPADKRDITFEVLNGSGIPGAAASAANELRSLGYGVVSVGNTTVEPLHTRLFVADAYLSDAPRVFADVFTRYGLSTVAPLAGDTTVSARLVIGK